jgi:hypothetical protein
VGATELENDATKIVGTNEAEITGDYIAMGFAPTAGNAHSITHDTGGSVDITGNATSSSEDVIITKTSTFAP